MNDQVAEIQRALDALETYSTVWITNLTSEGMSTKEIMFYKNADGTSIWFEMMKVRSELLLARALATGPLAQAAEAATDDEDIDRFAAFQAAYNDAVTYNFTVRELVENFQEKYGKNLTVEFVKWLSPRLETHKKG